MKSSRTLFVRYLCLNLILVCLASAVILALMGAAPMWWGLFQIVAVIVVIAQYPLLLRTSSWGWRFALFLLGMLVGLFLYGIILAMILPGTPYLTAGIMMMFFGSIFGFIPCVFIVLVNWLLEAYLYPLNVQEPWNPPKRQ